MRLLLALSPKGSSRKRGVVELTPTSQIIVVR